MAEQPQTLILQPPDQETIKYSEFAGIRNDIDPERFDPMDLVSGTNIDIDKSGRIARRPGFTRTATGVFHSIWSDNILCLAVLGGMLVKLSTAYVTTNLRALVDTASWVSYAKVNDRVYFSNGTDRGIVEFGAYRTWGIAVPTLPGVTVTVGDMLAGTYQFSITYSRADGQESGAPLAGVVVVPEGGGLIFTLPVSTDPGVALKTIYLSTPNGEVLYVAATASNAITTMPYTNSTLELNLPLITQFLSPPPAGQLVGYYRGHMFVAVGEVLYSSEPYAYELFDLRKGIQMDGRITLFAPMEDKERMGDAEGTNSGLFLGTDKSCGVLIGKDAAGFQYVPKVDYGAIEGAVDFVDGSLYGDNSAGARLLPMWLTTQGICVGMPQMEIKNLTRTRFNFTASGITSAGRGSAIFIPGPNKYIATSNF